MSKRPKQNLLSIVKNNFIMLKKVAIYTPSYFVWMIIEGIISGAINISSTVFSFYLLNAVGDGKDFLNAVGIIGIMALFHLIAYGFHRWYWNGIWLFHGSNQHIPSQWLSESSHCAI